MKTNSLRTRTPSARNQRDCGAMMILVLVVLVLIGALLVGVTRQTSQLRAELRLVERRQVQHWTTNAVAPAGQPPSKPLRPDAR